MDHYLKPVNPEDANNRAIRGNRAHYQASQGQAAKRPARKPSYLDKARDAFVTVVNGQGDIDELWTYVRNQIADSYWNGVDHGASGKVKPKTERAS